MDEEQTPDSQTPIDPLDALRTQWQALPASSRQLLCLRASQGLSTQYVEFTRLEKHSRELSYLRLEIHLPGQLTHKEINVLELWAEHATRRLTFGPAQGLHSQPENRGLAGFLLAQGALWAGKFFANHRLAEQDLPATGLSDTQRGKRQHLLERLGLSVDEQDRLSPVLAQALHGSWNNEKVMLLEPSTTAQMLHKAERELHDQGTQIRLLEDQLLAKDKERSAARFATNTLALFCVIEAMLLLAVMLFK